MTTTALTHSMTEEQLLQAITEAATLYGWRWFHIRRSDKALQQGHPGFPDLVLARNQEVIFLELKAAKGRVSPEQREWLTVLGERRIGRYGSSEAMVVRPVDLDEALGLLK